MIIGNEANLSKTSDNSGDMGLTIAVPYLNTLKSISHIPTDKIKKKWKVCIPALFF